MFLYQPTTPKKNPTTNTAAKLYTPPISQLLIGTGSVARPISRELRESLAQFGWKVDVMASRAAGTTFTFLNQEV